MSRRPGYWETSFEDSTTLRDRERRHSNGHHGYRFYSGEDEEGGEPCARGERCEERDYEGNAKRCPQPFCRKDRGFIVAAVHDLPTDYASLRDELLPRSTQQGERVSGSKEPPLPLAADVQAFMREIVHVALSWEEHVRAANRLADLPPERRRDEIALWQASLTLEGHVDSLIALGPREVARYASRRRLEEIEEEVAAAEEAGDEGAGVNLVRWDASGDAWENKTMTGVQAALELLGLHARVRGMRGLSRRRLRITEVDCDQCQSRGTLVQREGLAGGWEPVIRCTVCPNVYDGDRFTLLSGRIYEAQMRALRHAA